LIKRHGRDDFFLPENKKRRKKEKEKKMFAGRSASKGSDAKVPDKYLSYTKSLSDASTTVLEVRPITPPYMDITGNGNNMLSFSFPNNPDQFLLSDTVFLSGSIQINITSDDEKDTFAELKPAIPKLFTILQQHRFRVGGQIVDECTNSNLNCLHWNCKTNSIEDLQIQPYGDGSFIAGQTAPAYRAFRIPLHCTTRSSLAWREPPKNSGTRTCTPCPSG